MLALKVSVSPGVSIFKSRAAGGKFRLSGLQRVNLEKRRENTNAGSNKSGSKGSTEVAERRSGTRKPFVSEAVVVEINSGARLFARSCDIVGNGCYVDTLNPFAEGTIVRLRLQHGDSKLEAKGKVVYRVPSMGMGLEFVELTIENQRILHQWLAQTNRGNDPTEVPLPPRKAEPIAKEREREDQIVQLIYILKMKGILTNAEVALLLKETID
jgi:hypothetical protein